MDTPRIEGMHMCFMCSCKTALVIVFLIYVHVHWTDCKGLSDKRSSIVMIIRNPPSGRKLRNNKIAIIFLHECAKDFSVV